MTLKELLECEFTINENGIMVGEIPLERINKIADILTEQKQRIDKAIEYIKKYESIKAYYEYVDEDGYDEYNYDEDFKEELLEILGDKE